MKRKFFFLFFALLAMPFVVKGQQLEEQALKDSLDMERCELAADTLAPALSLPLSRPLFSMAAPGFEGCYPWLGSNYGALWDLHEGFNAQLGMSVSAGWGKYAPKGAGFGQSAAFAYATPLSKRFSFAAGIYAQNMDWGSFHHTDVGLSAVLGFKVNEKFSLYGYATKSLMPKDNYNNVGYFPMFMGQVRDRLGAMAEIKFNENFKMQFSVETSTAPDFFIPEVPYGRPMGGTEMTRPMRSRDRNVQIEKTDFPDRRNDLGNDRPSRRYR